MWVTILFVVADGDVTVITHTAAKERITLAGLSCGDVFGELSLVTGVRGATVLAAKESKLLRLSHDDFRRIVSQEPGLGEMLLTRVVERQDQLGRPENLGLDPETPNAAVRGALFEKIRRFFAV
ncbi:MAG: cyclic nucleotide-binding domain-containing protein [Polyangiaceae bacterium]